MGSVCTHTDRFCTSVGSVFADSINYGLNILEKLKNSIQWQYDKKNWSRGDDIVGKSDCYTSMRAWVQIPNISGESQAWLCAPVSQVLGSEASCILGACSLANLAGLVSVLVTRDPRLKRKEIWSSWGRLSHVFWGLCMFVNFRPHTHKPTSPNSSNNSEAYESLPLLFHTFWTHSMYFGMDMPPHHAMPRNTTLLRLKTILCCEWQCFYFRQLSVPTKIWCFNHGKQRCLIDPVTTTVQQVSIILAYLCIISGSHVWICELLFEMLTWASLKQQMNKKLKQQQKTFNEFWCGLRAKFPTVSEWH